MLNEIFSWIIGDGVEPDFSQKIITRSVLEAEHAHAFSKRRELLAELYMARSRLVAEETISNIAKRISQLDAYLSFMTFYAKQLGEHAYFNSLFFSLKYLISVGDEVDFIDKKEEKINRIFFVSFNENKEETLKFFHDNEKSFERFMHDNLMVSAEKTTEYLVHLTAQLSTQENALSIAHYFGHQLDDPEKFAAIVLWLVRRGVPTEQIIETDLLQKFMLYHSVWLGTPNSPIQYLYWLLGMFPEARGLIEEASTVQCEDRSFHCEEGGTHSHSIMGILSEQSGLHRVEIKSTPLEFTPTVDNFESLYSLFGSIFLRDALFWHVDCVDETWAVALHDFLNREASVAEQLPTLLNFIGIGGKSIILRELATLIDDATVEKLATRHNGAVLHLLPYKPFLLIRIGERDIAHYLSEMQLLNDDVGVHISQLLALLVAFRDVNKTVATQVFEAILDLALQHSHFLDDEYLLRQLRKFSEAEAILTNRYIKLQAQFDDCITEQVASGTMTAENYHKIEDHWLGFSRKLVLLNEIILIPNNCPNDKYRLQAHWAKQYFLKHAGAFIIDDYVQALEIIPELLADRVSEYERVLIELLTTIDDDGIRDTIIAKLDANEARRDQWMQMEYSDGCVFNGAAVQGNVGLIRWLEPRIAMDPDAINNVVWMAAEAQQWNVVEYFCSVSLHKPQQHVLKELLSLAAKGGQRETIRLLCEGAITHLQAKHIEHVLERAAVYGHLNLVQYCCHRETCAPSAAMVASAFKKAVRFNQRDIVNFIGNLSLNPQLLSVVERELVYASMRDNLPMVQLLCGLVTNVPRQTVIDEAFVKAIKFGNLTVAQYLYALPVNAPSQKAMDEALGASIANGYLPGVQYLCNLPDNGPRQGAIDEGLLQAVRSRRLDIVQFLCGLEATLPRKHVIEQAMLLATKLGNLPIVLFLSHLVNTKIIFQTMQVAAKEGHLPIVQYCCELHPAKRKAIYDARKKALSSRHTDVVEYFNELLDLTPTPSPILPSSPIHTSPRRVGRQFTIPADVVLRTRSELHTVGAPHFIASRDLELGPTMRKSLSCQALGTLGVFGSRAGMMRQTSLTETVEPTSSALSDDFKLTVGAHPH